MDLETPGTPGGFGESPLPPPPPRRVGKPLLLVVVAVAAVAGFLLVRRSGVAPAAPAASAPAPGSLIASMPVQLSPKAAMIADRFHCLCGECQDTLGACTCTRDKGSNEMKSTLNRIVEEKKTLSEIEAAMVARYGSKVLASPAASAPQPSGK